MGILKMSSVNVNNCKCKSNPLFNCRYSLELEAQAQNNGGKVAIVIMKNPASTAKAKVFFNVLFADLYDIDKTTSCVIKCFLDKNNNIQKGNNILKYDKVITLNLFPYYDNIPAAINSIYSNIANVPTLNITGNQSYDDNIAEIKNQINSNPNADIILAWGNANGIRKDIYDKAKKDIVSIITQQKRTCYEWDSSNKKFQQIGNISQVSLKNPVHASRWI